MTESPRNFSTVPPNAVDLVADRAEVRAQERPHPLRVGAVRAQREVDQVDEQNGDVADLLVERQLRRLDDLGAAPATAMRRRLPDRLGLDPAGQRDRGEARVAEARAGSLVGRLADGDAAGRRGALELARDVDDVAGDDADRSVALAIDGDRVGVHADADGEVEPWLVLVELLDDFRDAQRDTDGALGVIAVAVVGAEDGHDGVADELLHATAAALDLVLDARVERALERADVRRVGAVRARRETDEIGEENRDEPLLVHAAIVARHRTGGAGIAPGRLRRLARQTARVAAECGGCRRRPRAPPSERPSSAASTQQPHQVGAAHQASRRATARSSASASSRCGVARSRSSCHAAAPGPAPSTAAEQVGDRQRVR